MELEVVRTVGGLSAKGEGNWWDCDRLGISSRNEEVHDVLDSDLENPACGNNLENSVEDIGRVVGMKVEEQSCQRGGHTMSSSKKLLHHGGVHLVPAGGQDAQARRMAIDSGVSTRSSWRMEGRICMRVEEGG